MDLEGAMAEAGEGRGAARVVRANRAQLSWDLIDLEAWLPADHPARLVWGFVETLDLTPLLDRVRAREGEPGRPAADPAVLLGLWLLATIDGVGSARELDRLTTYSLPYRWLAGGVPVNYHGLADFRVAHAEALDALLTSSLAALMAEGLVTPEEIIVDGTKVRASAGKSSFKRAQTLDVALRAARERVAALKAEVDDNPGASVARREAARARAARDVEARVAKARVALAAIDAERRKRARRSPKEVAAKAQPRVSMTDPDARRMRFADGAVRAAYNVQLAVTSAEGFIVAALATDRRNDSGLARPMLEAAEARLGMRVKRLLADTNYACLADIAALESRAGAPVTVFAAPQPEKEDVKPETLAARRRARGREPDAVKAWRARMETDEAEAAMRRRSRIERVNAQVKRCGLGVMPVRGLLKTQAVAGLHALAHNLRVAWRLRAARAAA
jgi:transposase